MQPENQPNQPDQQPVPEPQVQPEPQPAVQQPAPPVGGQLPVQPSEAEALPQNIDPSLVAAAQQRDQAAAVVVEKTIPKWVKPAAIGVAIAAALGSGVWAFFAFYWNSNEQIMLRILAASSQQSNFSTNSTVSIKYRDMDISADVDFATDGKSGQFGFDGEVRYGSNRYDTSATLVGDHGGYALRLKNPRQFLYDLSGVYAKTTQTDGMYDVLSDKLDNKWLQLDDATIEELAGTDKLTKAIACTAIGTAPVRNSDMSRQEFADLFKQNPFLSIEPGRDDVVNSIPARTYVLHFNEAKMSAFIDSYTASEGWRQSLKCYGPDLKKDLQVAARALEKDFSFALSVSKSTMRILKLSGSANINSYTIVLETMFSQEGTGVIAKPNAEVSVKDIEPELKPINIWLEAQRAAIKAEQAEGKDKSTDAKTESTDKTDDKQPATTNTPQ